MKQDSFLRIARQCENLLALSPANLTLAAGAKAAVFLRFQLPSLIAGLTDAAQKKQLRTLEHMEKVSPAEARAVVWIDAFRFGYVTLRAHSPEEEPYYVTFGPVSAEKLRPENLRFAAYKNKLGSDACLVLETFSSALPVVGIPDLKKIAAVLRDCFSPLATDMPIILEDMPSDGPPEERTSEGTFELRSFVDENYAVEGRLLSAVEHGDVDLIRTSFANSMRYFSIQPRFPGNPLREMKNLTVTGNSILLRAAIKGGLNPSLAHNMSHSFAIRIEQQTNVDEINSLMREISLKYAEAVHDYALRNCSELTKSAVILIHRSISAPLSLSGIAQELHVSREYLCRRFHQEMGVPLMEYVHRAKVQEACPLLLARKYNVARIAFLFGYSSPAHFTKTFVRYMGVSPKQWQNGAVPRDLAQA